MLKILNTNKVKEANVDATPGTIIITKKNWFGRQWSKLTKNSDIDNVVISSFSSPIYSLDNKPKVIYKPIKVYNKKEIGKLLSVYDYACKSDKPVYEDKDVLTIINIVRPNTVDLTLPLEQLDNNKYYNKFIPKFHVVD